MTLEEKKYHEFKIQFPQISEKQHQDIINFIDSNFFQYAVFHYIDSLDNRVFEKLIKTLKKFRKRTKLQGCCFCCNDTS